MSTPDERVEVTPELLHSIGAVARSARIWGDPEILLDVDVAEALVQRIRELESLMSEAALNAQGGS